MRGVEDDYYNIVDVLFNNVQIILLYLVVPI